MRFTIRDVLWLTVVVAIALAVYLAKPRRTEWEYKTQDVYWYEFDSTNAEGKEGWEIIQLNKDGNTITVYFKRPKASWLPLGG
jgi:hypothetical protein